MALVGISGEADKRTRELKERLDELSPKVDELMHSKEALWHRINEEVVPEFNSAKEYVLADLDRIKRSGNGLTKKIETLENKLNRVKEAFKEIQAALTSNPIEAHFDNAWEGPLKQISAMHADFEKFRQASIQIEQKLTELEHGRAATEKQLAAVLKSLELETQKSESSRSEAESSLSQLSTQYQTLIKELEEKLNSKPEATKPNSRNCKLPTIARDEEAKEIREKLNRLESLIGEFDASVSRSSMNGTSPSINGQAMEITKPIVEKVVRKELKRALRESPSNREPADPLASLNSFRLRLRWLITGRLPDEQA